MANNITFEDISDVTSSAPSRVSSRSSSGSSADKRKVTAITTSVSRNVSSGNAVQINGPVAGKIYNLNFKNLVVNCHCSLTSKIAPHTREIARLPNTTSKTSTESIIEIPDGESGFSNIPTQNIILSSKSSGKRKIVRAIFRPDVPDNFIARRIVHRLELTAQNDSLVVKRVVWGRTPIPPTSDFVDLACYAEEGNDCVAYRFYVVKHCSFDLLFGLDSGSMK